MNKAKYASLPPEAKAAIDKNSGEAFAKIFGKMFDQNNQAVYEAAKKDKKRVITVLSAEQQKPWRRAVASAIEEWKKSNPDGERMYKAFADEVAAIEAGQ